MISYNFDNVYNIFILYKWLFIKNIQFKLFLLIKYILKFIK